MRPPERRRNTRATASIKEDLEVFAQAGERLKAAGLLRTNNLVGDVGGWIAARYYGVQLAKTVIQGYDLATQGGLRFEFAR